MPPLPSPITLELLTPLWRSVQGYRAATNRMPAAICFSALDPIEPGLHAWGIPCITDLKLEPGAVDVIDHEGWAVGRLWKDGTTRP